MVPGEMMDMVALVLVCLLPGQVPTLENKDFTKEIQQAAVVATVRIVNTTEGTDGSGVLLQQEEPFAYFLTADHVVGKAKQLDVVVFSPASYPRQEKVYKRAEVLARDARADLALIRIVTRDVLPQGFHLCPTNKAPDSKGAPALAVGCEPGGAPLPMIDVITATRVVSKPGEQGKAKCWETAKGPIAGRSGGPLIDTQGRLLGVASGTSGGKGYYIHLDEIRNFLKRNALGWLAEEPPPVPGQRDGAVYRPVQRGCPFGAPIALNLVAACALGAGGSAPLTRN